MDSKAELYIKRADDKIILARINFDISINKKFKDMFKISENITFFNDVISGVYYAIFYAAKAYLLCRGIETFPPEEHRKTYEAFRDFVESGVLDKELLRIYDSEADKAETLLKIFFREKGKRGRFTYNMNANANIPFAEESINNAILFVSLIKKIVIK